MAQIGAELSFLESEILEIPSETIKQFLAEKEELQTFEKRLTDLLERKPFVLSPDIEETLAALSEVHDAPYMIYKRSKSSDMQFDSIVDEDGNEHPMSFALYEDKYEISPDNDLRRKAFDSFVKTLNQYKNTFAAVYATEVNKQVTLAKLRGYNSVTDMLLQPQQVTKEMYHNQLDVIQEELAPHMQRLARLKQRDYGLDQIRFCDLIASFDLTFSHEIRIDDATEMILNISQYVVPEYSEIMNKGLTERWVDYADNVGKSTGAF